MKLFLSSLSISEEQKADFSNFVGKPLSEISFALIENAADPYDEKSKGFVFETRQSLESLGMKLKRVGFAEYINKPKELHAVLKGFDVIWFGGGNIYYLRWLMKQTGFDTIVREILNSGVAYGGGSAGAIIAGRDLKYFDLVDDPKLAPEVIYTGLGLTDLTLIPHWKTERMQSKLEEIRDLYTMDGQDVVTIEDGQSVLIDGDIWKLV